ncbi:MAG: hypothetical protein Unbinned4944contig1000_34 [Prokaryotic dsDNA virus sp.]|nr:MAG: hypothetical protein Unbinned4944contig1000_34 [Prokaryotic dsDNA virus sp.]
MNRATWLTIWTATAIVLIAMIEMRPLWGLSSALFLSVVLYTANLISLTKRRENEDEKRNPPCHD